MVFYWPTFKFWYRIAIKSCKKGNRHLQNLWWDTSGKNAPCLETAASTFLPLRARRPQQTCQKWRVAGEKKESPKWQCPQGDLFSINQPPPLLFTVVLNGFGAALLFLLFWALTLPELTPGFPFLIAPSLYPVSHWKTKKEKKVPSNRNKKKAS